MARRTAQGHFIGRLLSPGLVRYAAARFRAEECANSEADFVYEMQFENQDVIHLHRLRASTAGSVAG